MRAHIFLETKVFKSELRASFKKWFYNPEAFLRTEKMNKLDQVLGTTPMKPGFSDKLFDLFKMIYHLRECKTELKAKDGFLAADSLSMECFISSHWFWTILKLTVAEIDK